MTEHVAQEQQKKVVLQTWGLQSVPPKYQAAIKNVTVQLIRNAVLHGIEQAAVRVAAGKPPHGTLRLDFRVESDHYELSFEDDGCGLNPDLVRATAIARGVVTGEAASRMRDREAIKLIFRSAYTTLADSPTDKTHGMGMALVRRYVHEAGGKIALASLPGHETRFKIILPLLPPVEDDAPASELALAATGSHPSA
jgi:two-component system chemotaxis sensor kinase CheA